MNVIVLLSALIFATSPADTSAMLAADCMTRGHQVVEMSANQVKCQVSLTREEQAHMLFIRFHQRRLNGSTVRQYIAFTSVPAVGGSIVQHRVWIEADINGQTRFQEGDNPEVNAALEAHLVTLGGTRQ